MKLPHRPLRSFLHPWRTLILPFGLCLVLAACSQAPKTDSTGHSQTERKAVETPSVTPSATSNAASPNGEADDKPTVAPVASTKSPTNRSDISKHQSPTVAVVRTASDSSEPSPASPPVAESGSVQTSDKAPLAVATTDSNDNASAASSSADDSYLFDTTGEVASATKRARWTDSHLLAVKTNVAYDLLTVQNLAVEVELDKRISLDFPVMWNFFALGSKHALRTIAFQPEARWWLRSAHEGGHFVGVHTHLAWYNCRWGDTRYQTAKRPLVGAGISYGYRLPFHAHWAAEANIGFGYANTKYDTYYNIDNGALIDTHIRHYWGVTRAGLSLVYLF